MLQWLKFQFTSLQGDFFSSERFPHSETFIKWQLQSSTRFRSASQHRHPLITPPYCKSYWKTLLKTGTNTGVTSFMHKSYLSWLNYDSNWFHWSESVCVLAISSLDTQHPCTFDTLTALPIVQVQLLSAQWPTVTPTQQRSAQHKTGPRPLPLIQVEHTCFICQYYIKQNEWFVSDEAATLERLKHSPHM